MFTFGDITNHYSARAVIAIRNRLDIVLIVHFRSNTLCRALQNRVLTLLSEI